MDKLQARIALLEAVIRSVPGYSENWNWEETNYEVLKTIPGHEFRWCKTLDRWEAEKAEEKAK